MSEEKHLFKILCCDHFLTYLNVNHKLEDYEVNEKFEECTHDHNDHEIMVVKCEHCPYNLSHGFERNYFTSIRCSCKSEPRFVRCQPCMRLCRDFNKEVLKICMKKSFFHPVLFIINLKSIFGISQVMVFFFGVNSIILLYIVWIIPIGLNFFRKETM